MKKVFICWAVMALCIVAAVLLRKPAANAKLDYKEVKALVVSSETRQIRNKYSSTTQTKYEIVVRYEGKEYDLKNANNAYSYREGQYVTVYLSGGKLYANLEGVRSATPLGIACSVATAGAFLMFILSMVMLAKTGQQGKEA